MALCFLISAYLLIDIHLCEEQARIERAGCGEEASTNVLHNDELTVGVPKSFCFVLHTYTTSYYFIRPWPWYNRADDDTASSHRHQNPDIALRRALRQSSPSIASNSHVDGLVIFRRMIGPRSALSP